MSGIARPFRGCPMFHSFCNKLSRAREVSYKINKLNKYIDMDKIPEDKEADMKMLRSREHELLMLNSSVRGILLRLRPETWKALTGRGEFCDFFQSVFGWYPYEIEDTRRPCGPFVRTSSELAQAYTLRSWYYCAPYEIKQGDNKKER
ncbi:hypothetical protein EKO27_g9545 [Xylaria grammica]|uniref:Uncharacterized protein n=1 Tax=Xylaria grammica TaxID=363999 RepID=A0A439CTU1_9PEZI|nr:hypothetical protein EKO27_g9545 [Xylaria grammica]